MNVVNSKTPMKRILWLSDYANSGFGVVAKNLLAEIGRQAPNLQIDVVAINFYDEEPLVMFDGRITVMDGRYVESGKLYDQFSRYMFCDLLIKNPEAYDGVFLLGDISTYTSVIDVMKQTKANNKKINRKSFKSILYTPIDGNLVKSVFDKSEFFDLIVTYNNYSKGVIGMHRPDLKSKVRIQPHGVSTKDFFPISKADIADFRKEFFGAENADKIIFTNVNRNQPRKSLTTTIFSFIEAKQINDTGKDILLYLHCQANDLMGQNLIDIIAQTELVIGKDIMIAPDSFWDKQYGVSIEMLNKIYNASDIFITTTLGEGWGLSVTEAMACRLPTILPQNTSLIEIGDYGKRCHAIENQYPICLQDNVIRDSCDALDVAEVMISAAKQRIKGTDIKMIDAAEAYVKTLKWDTIAKDFIKYFNDLF